MKLGPGVDLLVPIFHARDGLFFQRQSDGAVRVMATNGEYPLATGQNLRADVTLDASEWASVVASTYEQGTAGSATFDSAALPDHLG